MNMGSDIVFKCPSCGSNKVRVVQTTQGTMVNTHYLQCMECDHHWVKRR